MMDQIARRENNRHYLSPLNTFLVFTFVEKVGLTD